jgi:hypothetical protein
MTSHCITDDEDDEDDASMEGVPQKCIRKGSSKANPKVGCMTTNLSTSRVHDKQRKKMKTKAQARRSSSSIKKKMSSSLQKGSGAPLPLRTEYMVKNRRHYAILRVNGEIPSAGKCQASKSIATVASRKLAPV